MYILTGPIIEYFDLMNAEARNAERWLALIVMVI